MFQGWTRLSREQKRVWKVVAGGIAAGTVFKVAYFSFSRNLIVSDTNRQQKEGLERLREAKEFAEWSRQDREKRLPPLNSEQKEQLRQYLKIVQEHGLQKAFQDPNGKECEGCPVLNGTRKALSALAASVSD